MTFTCRYVQRSPAVSVCAVNTYLCLIRRKAFQYLERPELISYFNCQPKFSSDFFKFRFLNFCVLNSLNFVNSLIRFVIFIFSYVFFTISLLPFFLLPGLRSSLRYSSRFNENCILLLRIDYLSKLSRRWFALKCMWRCLSLILHRKTSISTLCHSCSTNWLR